MKSTSPLPYWLITCLVVFSYVSLSDAAVTALSTSKHLRVGLVQDPFPGVPRKVWTKQQAPPVDPIPRPPSQDLRVPVENPDEVKWHLRIGEKPLPPVEPTVGPRLYATPPPAAPAIKYAPVTSPPPVAVTESPYWRPWETRWDPKPINMSSPDYINRPENRRGYRAFAKEHPRHALAPNSVDSNAESTVILVFVICILASVVLGIVVGMEMAQSHKLEALASVTILPWILLDLWTMYVFVNFAFSPTRSSVAGGSHWQCNGLVWYLFFSPWLTALACAAQLVWVWQKDRRDSSPAPMGRMFDASRDQESSNQSPVLKIFSHPAVYYGLLAAQFVLSTFGIIVVFFTGHNRDFCEPEVWWTSALMVTATVIAEIIALAATFFFLCLSQFLKLSFVQDFMRSFHDSSVDDAILEQQKFSSEEGWGKQPSVATGTPSYRSSGSAHMPSSAWPAPFTPSATSRSSNLEWLSVGSPAQPVQFGAASPSFAGNRQPQSFSGQERKRSLSPASAAPAVAGAAARTAAPTFGGT